MNEVARKAESTVTVEIDGIELEAPKGAMVIEVADRAGITIPRFCYHRKLSIAANCRMCLVDVEKAPKPLPACATPVMDGMKVYTRSKRAQSAQQNVMEFLLINHPLDCPICDQGGECELQDVSMGFGRSISRFTERKRVVKDEDLGSLISTDMTRCIHCTRCVRFLEEIAGTHELGGMGRGETTMISTFIGRSVDSELSGNIIDLCPVGALTNKPFRYTARAWELRSRASVAGHDAVGSNLHYHLRQGRIMRAVPRDNEAVNETWLPDRDRWGFHGLHADDRATQPLVRGTDGRWQVVSWDEGIDRAAGLLTAHDADETGFLLSGRATNEELYLARKLAGALGTPHVDHRLRQRDFRGDAAGVGRPMFGRALTSLRACDAMLVVGSNLRHDQPLLGHQLRQAARAGGRIALLDAVRYGYDFRPAVEQILRPSALPQGLAAIAAAAGVPVPAGQYAAQDPAVAERIARLLANAERGTILLGSQATRHVDASVLRALARLLAEATGSTLCEIPDGANGMGAWQAGALPHLEPGGARAARCGRNVAGMVDTPPGAFLTLDFEPGPDTAYGGRLRRALEGASVVHLGSYLSDEVRAVADVVLPLAPAPECDGSFTNLDGRLQSFEAAGTPPGDARAGWKVLRVLGHALGFAGFGHTRVEQVRDEFLACQAPGPQDDPAPVLPERVPVPASGLELHAEVPLYAVDGQVRRAQPLQETAHGEVPAVALAPADAEALGVAQESRVEVRLGADVLRLPVRVDDRLPAGVARIAMGVVTADLAAGTIAVSAVSADD